MSEPPVTEAVRRNMQANRGRDTSPELAIRSLLHAAGLRYRVNTPLPFNRRRRADITFTRVGLYVFIDGCFWHGCPEHYVVPKTRTDYWTIKIANNRERDSATTDRLRSDGNIVLRFWEHMEAQEVADTITSVYRRLLRYD